MKKFLILFLGLSLCSQQLFAALTLGTQWHVTATATTGNVNGSGFNPANANMLTDLTTDANTANTASPVCSSASYNFAAGDVGHWLYIKSGTNWTPGWYQIASVASNKATLTAGIGTAQITSLGFKAASTVIGCATVGTPTNGTFTIDYSQGDTAKVNGLADFNAVGASTTLTSATAGFTPVMVGNIFHQTTTGTGAFGIIGWYEIATYVNATTVTLDSTPNTGTASVNTTGYVGGAGRFNALEDAYMEMLPAGSNVYIKSGTYTFTGSISVASTLATATNPTVLIGFTSMPGDASRTSNANWPVFAQGANSIVLGQYQNLQYLVLTGTPATLVTLSFTAKLTKYCKFLNTSTTVNRTALGGSSSGYYQFLELISQNGTGLNTLSTAYACYFHDSTSGITGNIASASVINCVFANILTTCFGTSNGTGQNAFYGNTFYGRSSSPTSTGFNPSASNPNNHFYNNIFSSLATAILQITSNSLSSDGAYNDFYNNTTDATLYTKNVTDLALDPGFTSITEIAITNGTLTGGTAVLTSSGADFSSVQDNVDFFRLTAQTGGTGTFIANYLITSHTTTTLTFNNVAGTSGSATSITGYVCTGQNYGIGTNLKAQGYPGPILGSESTSYLDIGAVQRQEGTAGGSFPFAQ
jgi:hypothetical protein